MNSYIERVARNIALAQERNGGPPYELLVQNKHTREWLFDEARAAVEAMREPGVEMLMAGNLMFDQGENPHVIFTAMMDAALVD